jgi:hypothetical protein
MRNGVGGTLVKSPIVALARMAVPAVVLCFGLYLVAGSYHPSPLGGSPIEAGPFAVGTVVSIVGGAFLIRALRDFLR